jgi:hypothetical protein
MSNHLRILPVVASALVLGLAGPAPAVAGTSAAKAGIQTQQSRLGGFRSARRPSFGSRYRSRPYRPRVGYRRPSLFRGILRALGLAYLVHLLFGWGAGGSPLGLLLLVAIVGLLVTMRRRRRSMAW